jgi:hypothetical protein
MSLPKDEGSIQPDVVPVGIDFDGLLLCRWNEPYEIHKIQRCSKK